MKVIDTHAHILSEETMRLIGKEAPKVNPNLKPIDKEFAVIEVAGVAYKPFPRGAWDMEKRLADMDSSEVDIQVISITPQTFLYNQDASLNAVLAAIQNDQIAKHVKAQPERLIGIATLPMQDGEKAAAELRRSMTSLGLRGAEIGSNVNGKNLDDPALEPLWTAANELKAFIMVHPTQVAGMDRLQRYYLNNLIGNPLDTTIAAASLVFGGVIDRYPAINFLMVHGGGFIPYQQGRWQHGWHVRPEPKVYLKQPPKDSIDTLYFDSILHAKPQLEALVALASPSRVVLGSDYPFDMGTLECAREVKALSIPAADKEIILSKLPLRLLGLES
jgi:aminocarboxymuconate-semialdehyde decarboxylase